MIGDLALTSQLRHHLVMTCHVFRHSCDDRLNLATPDGLGCNGDKDHAQDEVVVLDSRNKNTQKTWSSKFVKKKKVTDDG